MNDDESLSSMYTRFSNVINKLIALGKVYSNVEIVRKILNSLLKRWESKVTAILEARDLKKLEVNDLIRSLSTHEYTLKRGEEEGKPKKSLALKVVPHESESDEDEESDDQDEEVAMITKRIKIFLKEIKLLQRNPSKSFQGKIHGKKAMKITWDDDSSSSENGTNNGEPANFCLIAKDDLEVCMKFSISKSKWFLNSGCSRHMTGDKSKFIDLTSKEEGHMTFGDNSKGKNMAICKIGNESPLIIENVLLVEGLKHNLLSISELCDKGFTVTFRRDKCIILNNHDCKIYADDIIFGATNENMCQDFAQSMQEEFEMNMIGELNFFLGLQIKQAKSGTFINQSNYIKELLKKFEMEGTEEIGTPMSSSTKLDKDEIGKSVDSSYIDVDYAGCKVDRKSTSGTCHFLGHALVSW
ncbi:hypothetical protein F2P56_018382 [Juglans regia]|uniref:Reverse transcriptase Ty1/copia-type domain-containing protein n=1 Tax=Juglans regia TaxID=51240 RepID=A0A833U5C3_JUGRE|nr:hypothetical protein F2P56_018382 [Juglans regia]